MTFDLQSEQALKEEVLQAEEERCRAMNAFDWDVVEKMLADDFTYTHAYAKTQDKAEWLADVAQKRQFCVRDNLDVRIYGNGSVALMTGGMTRTWISDDGTPGKLVLVTQQTWTKNGGKWQLVAHIGVKNPAAD